MATPVVVLLAPRHQEGITVPRTEAAVRLRPVVGLLTVGLLGGSLLPQGTPLPVDVEVHQGDQLRHAVARDPRPVPALLALDLLRAVLLRQERSVVQDLILVRLAHAKVRTVNAQEVPHRVPQALALTSASEWKNKHDHDLSE